MEKTVIFTSLAPVAIGPYSQAIRAGNMLFVSGQVALDPAVGNVIDDRSVGAQTRRVLQNIQAIVTAAGASLESGPFLRIVKIGVFCITSRALNGGLEFIRFARLSWRSL